MKEVRIGVGVALFNPKGEVLLQLRSDCNQWGFLGGRLEFGESLSQCAIREVYEESKLIIDNEFELIGVYSLPEDTIVRYPEAFVQKIDVFIKGKILSGELQPNEEAFKLEFFDLNSLPYNIHINAKKPLLDLQNNVKNILR